MTNLKKINNEQYSRRGKSAITFFVSAEAKPKIRAALADAGYGCGYQKGITNMLQCLLEEQGRDPNLQKKDPKTRDLSTPETRSETY